jgi:2-phosphoglycerate kinase
MKMTQYDQVKVYVILETSRYIYSRFLMSRILTLIKVAETDAVKVTLEIKKNLVRDEIKEITQADLESILFAKLLQFGYKDDIVNRY